MESSATSVAEQQPRAPAAQPGKNQKVPSVGDVFNPYGMFNGIWVPESLLKCPDLSASAKLLYGRLARFAGENGRCFPSVETLAAELGMTARQVQRLIGQLCSAGFLRKEPKYRPNGSQTSNAYAFLYHASLAPARVIQSQNGDSPQPEKRRGDKNVTRDKRVGGPVTSAPPPEDNPLNSSSVNSSSSSAESSVLIQAAAAANPTSYPLSAARFREFFPRTTDSVIVRILRAIKTTCPDGTDEDIAAAVYVGPDQTTPGLWANTMPDRVRAIAQRRIGCDEAAAIESGVRFRHPEIAPYREDPGSAWAEAKVRLQERLTPEGFANWIEDTYQLDREGEVLTIAVPDVETQRWLESEYSTRVSAAVAPLNVRYVVTDRTQQFHTLFGWIASIQAEMGAACTDPVVSLEEPDDIDAVCQILDALSGVDVVAFCDHAVSNFEDLDKDALAELLARTAEFPGRARALGLVMEWARTWASRQRCARAAGGCR